MKAAAIVLLLAGCAASPVAEDLPIAGSVISQDAPAKEEISQREARTRKAVPKPPDTKAPGSKLPACESVPGDKRTAILQKLDCLSETGDIPVKPMP